jgi:formate C-acetyltransferase
MEIMKETIHQGGVWLRESAEKWPEVLPCPLFSSSMAGCLENARDYTRGSGKYNPAGIALVGFGTLVDALTAIRRVVFEEKWITLPRLRAVLKNNWAGAEELQKEIIALPKHGQADPSVDALAARVAHDLAEIARAMSNERGGSFQPSMFVYYAFTWMGQDTRATPDGRAAGDMLSQGCAPGRVRPLENIPDIFHSLKNIDFTEFPGNAVLDLQLPVGGKIQPAILAALLRTFAKMGGATLQLNCVSVRDLRDAKIHPDRHPNLTVRISGLSARFIALTPQVQDEIIARTLMNIPNPT